MVSSVDTPPLWAAPQMRAHLQARPGSGSGCQLSGPSSGGAARAVGWRSVALLQCWVCCVCWCCLRKTHGYHGSRRWWHIQLQRGMLVRHCAVCVRSVGRGTETSQSAVRRHLWSRRQHEVLARTHLTVSIWQSVYITAWQMFLVVRSDRLRSSLMTVRDSPGITDRGDPGVTGSGLKPGPEWSVWFSHI